MLPRYENGMPSARHKQPDMAQPIVAVLGVLLAMHRCWKSNAAFMFVHKNDDISDKKYIGLMRHDCISLTSQVTEGEYKYRCPIEYDGVGKGS